MYLYLILALFWATLGVGFLVWHWLDPHAPYRDVLGTGISAGWLGVVLAVYNLARWWSGRSFARDPEPAAARPSQTHGSRPSKAPEPNSPFDFDKPPSSAEGKAE